MSNRSVQVLQVLTDSTASMAADPSGTSRATGSSADRSSRGRPIDPSASSTSSTSSTSSASTTTHTRRGWAFAGLGAAVFAGIHLVASMTFGGSLWDDPAVAADNERAVEVLAGDRGALVVFSTAGTIAALLLGVFAAGLRRRLVGQSPSHSLAPTVATIGLGLGSALMLVGTGISTELFWGLSKLDEADADSLMSMYHLVATLSWVWAGVGLAAAAIAVAALKHDALPRWIGWASAVAGVIVIGFSLIPFQYLSAMFGTLWLLVVSIGLCASRERTV